jgi:hypothetical protein
MNSFCVDVNTEGCPCIPKQRYFQRISAFLILCLCFFGGDLKAQTDFAPAEIMFTGYDSDAPDAFSFVLLTDVVSGTVIAITDRGWSNSTGFRVDNTTEGTIELTFNANYPCGTEVIFTDTEDANDWDNPVNQNGIIVGTVVILGSGDLDGPELSTTGDQLFIYQNPVPTSGNQANFITAISMNVESINGSIFPWGLGANSDDNSALPIGLQENEVVAFVFTTTGGFPAELDNCKYLCTPKTGTADFLQSAITNENFAGLLKADNANNWNESDTYISLSTPCNFCCTDNYLTAPDIVSTNQVFTITINGTLPSGESWQLYTAGCGVGSPIQTTMTNSFTITAPATEGNVTYYVKASGTGGPCPGSCVFVSVCVENTPLVACTVCAANAELCGDCLMPDPDDNPDLDSGCYAIKLVFILDESGSIGGNAPQVADGVLSFLNALNGQDIQMALIEFSCEARYVTGYTPINNALIVAIEGYFNGIPFNGQTYNPNNPGGSCAGTNWHDAMIKADLLDNPDILMFFTDGMPTGWNTTWNACGDGQTTQTPEIVNPVKLANKFKGEGTHMFMLGVGSGIDEYNLQLMSGPIEYQVGVNTIGTADYSIGNFADLANDLEAFVNELCVTPLELYKELNGAVCDGVQQFRFIIHNPGTESAATVVEVKDTFPSGYTNIVYNGPQIKLCIGMQCWPQGYQAPDNAFRWTTNSLPPGESDTLILSVNVLPTGNYTNIAWAQGSNTDLVSDTITGDNITDNLDPTITCPPNVTIACSASTLPTNTGMPTANDPDGVDPDVSYNDNILNGSCTQNYTINRTWTATDGCANSASCIQVINVQDIVAPNMTCPENVTVQCTASTLPANTGSATATDNCSTFAITHTDIVSGGGCPQEGMIIRTWKATDACGNFNTCNQIIVIDDGLAPTLTCPANVTILCTASTLPANTGTASATDNCSTFAITSTDVVTPLGCPQEKLITRTWKATDACGNFSTCNQLITIDDNLAPGIACPPNVTIECTASTLPADIGSATATDNCSTYTITNTDVISIGACPQEKTIIRTWRATDACGNSSTCNQTIIIHDSVAPSITCPSNVTIACTASTLPANTGSATATDACSTYSITSTDVVINGDCPQEKTITRTWRATDACGNSSTCNQTITIDDSAAPVLTCPANVTIECTASTLPANTGTGTATDNCSTFSITSTDVISNGSCPQGSLITRTWKATDACGNSSTCNQSITIVDTTPPDLGCPDDVTVQCTESTLPEETGNATSTDNCDPSPTITHNDVTISGPTPHGYSIHRTWTATDHCSNLTTCLQTITVENPLDPEITGFELDTICSGNSVVFQAMDQGLGSVMYQWNFGSGSSPGTATGIGPHTVIYTYNGTNGTIGASVVLTVSLAGCVSVTDTVANIHVNPIPNPAIDAPTTNLCYFTNRTFKPVAPQIPGYTYLWNFGSGASIPPSNGYGPYQVEYSTTGSKTVQLIVNSNAAGSSCSDTATITFTVIACPGNISGKVRRQDGSGIVAVTVKLFPDNNFDGLPDAVPPIRSATTLASGVYSMVSQIPGQYALVESQPPGYISISDADETNDMDSVANGNLNDNIIPLTLEATEIDNDNVFVEAPSPGIISGFVFQDLDNDLIPDGGEEIDGVTISLYTDNDQNGIADGGGFVSSVMTSTVGYFEFGNVAVGNFVLTEAEPAGYISSSDIDLTNDSDNVPNSDTHNDVIPVTVAFGETDADNEFIETQVCGSVVTNINDNGPGSLRYVIDCAPDGGTITFHSSLQNQTIHLNSGRIVINKNIHILSSLTPRVKIYSDVQGAFKIEAGHDVEFKNIDVVSGLSGFPGAAFENYGNLIFWDMNIFRNTLLVPGNYLIYNSSAATLTVKGGIQIDNN